MNRPATSRLKCNPPLGRMPVLQFLQPGELSIDEAYQRSINTGSSQLLIRKIAQHWNWDLCQPLVVALRETGALFVIDGQHRLEAARLRGDIHQLPCVVVHYKNAADEAASFVHLNQQRRPLKQIDLFKAAVASEDPEACAILAAIEGAGLTVAPHSNVNGWKPGMIANIAGIETAWRRLGPGVTSAALRVLAALYPVERLQYAGTIFPGIAALAGQEIKGRDEGLIARIIGERSQKDWRNLMMAARADDPNLKFADASAKVIGDYWRMRVAVPDCPAARPLIKFTADEGGMDWCEQCEMRVTRSQADGCRSRFCSFRRAA